MERSILFIKGVFRRMKVHFSSDSNEWATPKSLFDILDEEFLFTLDPCATKDNAKCSNFYTKEDDGLLQDWGGGKSIYESTLW